MHSVTRLLPVVGWLLAAVQVSAAPAVGRAPQLPARASFVSYAVGADQARKAEVLVRSIRAFGGPFAPARVFLVADADAARVLRRSQGSRETLLPLEMPPVASGVPYAAKAYAAAQAERAAGDDVDTLIWMDPESVLIAPPVALVLADRAAVALQPVFLLNTVGFAPGEAVPPYWSRIYREAGVRESDVPTVRALVDDAPIRFYINCGVMAFRPSRGLGREWARALTALLADRDARGVATSDTLHAVFLHQAVLSAVLCARTRPEERQWIPVTHGYPLNLHDRVPAARRAARLNDVTCLIYDTVWDQQPDWLSKVPVDEPLRGWLRDAWQSLFRLPTPPVWPVSRGSGSGS